MANYNEGNYEYQQPGPYRPNYFAGRGGAQWGRGGFNRHPAPNLEAPPRFGPRSRGGFRRQQIPTQQAETVEKAEVPALPAPKHLSKTSSPLTNDPLYAESFMNELGTEIRRAPQVSEVRPGHYGFGRIVEEDYKSLTARSHIFGKAVSESMYAYYCGMLLNYRMLEVRRKNGRSISHAEADFCTQMECEPYTVTKTMEAYLAGFGNTTMPRLVECEFFYDKPGLQPGQNILGFFGPLATHPIDYATYVSPGVLAQRIVEDVARTVVPPAQGLTAVKTP